MTASAFHFSSKFTSVSHFEKVVCFQYLIGDLSAINVKRIRQVYMRLRGRLHLANSFFASPRNIFRFGHVVKPIIELRANRFSKNAANRAACSTSED
jgi:hypothetical protein